MGSDNDDLVPKRGRGRPMRPVSLAKCLAKRECRKNCVTCGICPKHGDRDDWCLVLAKVTKRTDPACDYGKLLISKAKRDGGKK